VDGVKQEFEMIIYCTGYHIDFPMFKPGFVEFRNSVPVLVNGTLHPKYKNLYIFGINQPRYGAGTLITLGANLGLCTLIRTQEKLKIPLSQAMLKLGLGVYPKPGRQSPDIIVDPHALCFKVRIGSWLIPKIPTMVSFLSKFISFDNKVS